MTERGRRRWVQWDEPDTGRSMQDWREMQAYVGFDADVDGPRLQAFLVLAEPHLDGVIDTFYNTLARYPAARAVLNGREQIERLKKTLRVWIRELLAGPWDEKYLARRERIGQVHVRVGLPDRYMFTAMNRMRSDLNTLAFAHSDDPLPLINSIGRVTDLDLAVMTHTFMGAQQREGLLELQQLVLHSMPLTVVCLDPKDQVTASTRPGARLVKEPLGDVLPPGVAEAADLARMLSDARVLDQDQVQEHVTVGDRHFTVRAIPLGHPQADVIVHVEEHTDVVRVQKRLAHAEGLAQIGAMAANLAHEIRNPLAAISSTLQVLAGSLAEDDRRKVVIGKLGGQVNRLNQLVTDLLGYAREPVPELRSCQLASLARDASIQSGVPIELIVERDLPVQVDPHLVVQILVNLLQNARDAGGDVTVTVRPKVLQVSDTGPGIDPSIRDTLFDPFVTTKMRGTGLGLAISRRLARSMSADLTLVASPVGSTFQFAVD